MSPPEGTFGERAATHGQSPVYGTPTQVVRAVFLPAVLPVLPALPCKIVLDPGCSGLGLGRMPLHPGSSAILPLGEEIPDPGRGAAHRSRQ